MTGFVKAIILDKTATNLTIINLLGFPHLSEGTSL
jgi:hypothetical protein